MAKKSKRSSEKTQDLTPLEGIQEEHKAIIDEYFLNGYNGTKAVQLMRPEITYATARQVFHQIAKKEDIRDYINDKRQALRASINIETEQIVKELLNFSFADVSDFDGLSAEEFQQLPPEQRRQVQGFKRRKKTYKDRNGKDVTEESFDVKVWDKMKSIDMLAKYVGLYKEDNNQKKSTINIKEMNVEELKFLQNILKK